MRDTRLGELLVVNKYITTHQLGQALDKQKSNSGQPIGQILCQLGSLRERDLEYVLDHFQKRRRLGEILVGQELISEERLKHALKASKEQKHLLGKTLIKQRLLTEEQVARAIALQSDLRFVSLSEATIDPELSRFVNRTFAQRLGIVPIRCHNGALTIAMMRPLQRDDLAIIETWCGMPIVAVIAKESDIILAQQKTFRAARSGEPAKLQPERLLLELSEDQERERGNSKYLSEYIGSEVDALTKRIIAAGLKLGTSDIHLETEADGMTVRYRLDGILQSLDLGDDAAQINLHARQIVSKLKILCNMDISERRRPQDSSFKMKVTKGGEVRGVDFRVSTVPTQYGENVVIRILDKRLGAITLEGLGYRPELVAKLYKVLETRTGLLLATGPTGSGKSTALYALLSYLNSPGVKTLTIEDPIEYSIDGITQTEVNEAIGNTFASLLRCFLRQDPDIIMVGEIRDQETATISLRAALTGHAVLSTLHTIDATSAVIRLSDMGLEPSLISDTLRCVLAQRLVRRICTKCKVAYRPAGNYMEELGLATGSGQEFFHGAGCPDCHFTGFNGRLPIVELWVPCREELMLLNRRPDNLSLRAAVFSNSGCQTMFDDGLRRVKEGETTPEELLRTVPYEQIEASCGWISAGTGSLNQGGPPFYNPGGMTGTRYAKSARRRRGGARRKT